MADAALDASGDALPRRFLFNVNFVFFATLASNTAGFFVAILLARALGPEGRGVTALYQAAVSLGFAFFNLGISAAAFYFVARRELGQRQAMEAGLTVTLLATGATAIGVLLARIFFADELSERHIPYALAILVVPALIQLRLVGALLRAQGRFGALNALELGLPLAMFLALGGVEVAVGLTVPRAVWAWSLAYLPLVAAGYAMVGLPAWPRRFASAALIVRAVRFGGQSQLTSLVQLLNYRVDAFMILILVNTAGVGHYTVATSQTEGLWIIANSVAIVLLTNITAGDAKNAARMTPLVCRNTLLITGVAAAVAALIAGLWIPIVFGADYEESVLPYLCLLPGTVALSGSIILASYVFSRGRPIINFWIGLVTLATTLPTNVLFIHLFGVPGAALSTSLGYGLDLALTSIAYRRLSGGSISHALLPRREDAVIYVDALRLVWRRLRPSRWHAARDLTLD
jgi:O-antigen/teichoic acid export membrane protein